MVALKREILMIIFSPMSLKQERRGGIETVDSFRLPQYLDGKQERRGGIETLRGLPDRRGLGREAGTPWWH